MKNIIFLIISGAVALGSCRKPKSDMPVVSREQRYVYQHGLTIDTVHTANGLHYGLDTNGNDEVFLYSNVWGGNDDIFDNEYWSNLWFSVAQGETSFSYTNEQLLEHHCYYSGSGAWGGYGSEGLDKGTISGTKNVDGSWDITIDITLKRTETQLLTSHIVTKQTFREGAFY